jgi:NADP-dependent 3-hydroxy acid dehydrogenase YdfG
MKNRFVDKVVIVTGASSGIGEATATEFAKNGSKVVLAARSAERLSEIVREINADGGEAIFIAADVIREEDCKNLIIRFFCNEISASASWIQNLLIIKN